MRAREQALPCQALEEDAAEREDVDRRRDARASPRACSGAMKLGVPTSTPDSVIARGRVPLAGDAQIDELDALDVSAGRKRLLGLRSRWMRPRPCRYASASASGRAMVSVSSIR